jgi:hypothetical protein
MNKEELLKQVNEYLKSLKNDEERLDFLSGIECCFQCGSLILPCFCNSVYDE